jgi:hypothetical protein
MRPGVYVRKARSRVLCSGPLRLAAAVGAALLVLPLASTDANARTRGERGTDKKAAAKTPPGPILAVVSLARQRIWIYGSDGLLAHSAVSTGAAGYRTPTGVFSIVQKSRFHRSNIYSDAPMPYMQRITWSGIALHAGVVPGYPASHGCIRLPHQFAVELWGMTRIGARVVVVPDDASVFDIEHPRLPVPAMTPARTAGGPAADRPKGIVEDNRSTGIVGVAHAETAGDLPAGPAKAMNPLERAKAMRQQAIADAAAKVKEARLAVEASAAKAAEANRAIGALRSAELALANAQTRREAAKSVQDMPDATALAKRALPDAEAELAAAERAAVAARADEAFKTPQAIAAAKAAWLAERADMEAAAALKATERNTEPISVFVSRKAGKVYIRQGWLPIYEADAVFKSPDTPLGTHVYVVKSAEDNGKTLRWLSVSLPPSRPAEPRHGVKHGTPREAAVPPAHSALGLTAADVLGRFDLAAETWAFIAERLWAGASLIVSDEGISNETGATTDFIVLTRH